jgi:two-component system chemotaxis response regulator CheY
MLLRLAALAGWKAAWVLRKRQGSFLFCFHRARRFFSTTRQNQSKRQSRPAAESKVFVLFTLKRHLRKTIMSKTVMVVDDSASVRQVVGLALRGAGYTVIEGVDGVDALSKLKGQKIHLIISDVNMPNMDGITFVTEVKKLPLYKFTPVIMLTTESQEGKKLQGQAAGARAWVVKPFQPAQMLAAVSKLILP